jgi:hypothetical protein
VVFFMFLAFELCWSSCGFSPYLGNLFWFLTVPALWFSLLLQGPWSYLTAHQHCLFLYLLRFSSFCWISLSILSTAMSIYFTIFFLF